MKKTYLETIKEQIDSNYFQDKIIDIFDSKKIDKKIKISMRVAFSFLGAFILIGVVLFCLINVVKFNKSQVIFGISGGISIILGIFSVFVAPIFNFNLIHKNFKKVYDFQTQSKFLSFGLKNLSEIEFSKIYVDAKNHLTFELSFKSNLYKMIYFENKLAIHNLENSELNKEVNITHNLNQLIKIYYSDLDKRTFTSLNSFTLCMEIKLKKFAKLVVTDFINCMGE